MPSLLRFDQTTSDWVIFAPSRARRPHDFRSRSGTASDTPDSTSGCPFCPGHEALAPQEIYAERSPGGATADWLVRVIPNKFPALRIEENHQRHDEDNGFRFLGGCGAHEVIIESPDHNRPLCEQPVEQVERVLRTAQVRYQDLMRDTRFQTVILFKNHGEGAGTSLRHPHWQLIATPVVPRLLRLKHQVATEYFDQTGDCLYCVMTHRELQSGRRVLAVNDKFVALLPYASHVPLRDVDSPTESRFVIRTASARPIATVGGTAENGAAETTSRPRQPGLQSHDRHRRTRRRIEDVLFVAPADSSAADDSRRL